MLRVPYPRLAVIDDYKTTTLEFIMATKTMKVDTAAALKVIEEKFHSVGICLATPDDANKAGPPRVRGG
eukprot:14453706-Alexandrium_andersonii.AAC.1